MQATSIHSLKYGWNLLAAFALIGGRLRKHHPNHERLVPNISFNPDVPLAARREIRALGTHETLLRRHDKPNQSPV
jgi:hypothetical protein